MLQGDSETSHPKPHNLENSQICNPLPRESEVPVPCPWPLPRTTCLFTVGMIPGFKEALSDLCLGHYREPEPHPYPIIPQTQQHPKPYILCPKAVLSRIPLSRG